MRSSEAGRRPVRRAWAAAAAVALGVVLLAVGAELGLPHLAVEGLGLVSVVGLLALVAGLVLVLEGGVRLVLATPGWWRLLVGGLTVVAVVLGVYVLAVPIRVAVPPRSAAPTEVPVGVRVEEVLVPTADGETLAGWYAPSRDGAAVVLLPGSGSSRASLPEHLRVLAEGGYGVLALDPRGHGASTGSAMDWGWYGDTDVPDAVGYLTGRDDVDPHRIAVVGLSMGGEEAIGAGGLDPRIRAVVAEGVTGRGVADLGWLADVYGWRGYLTVGVHQVQTRLADLLTPANEPPPLRDAVAAAAPRPILLVVAGARPDEAHAAEHLRDGAPDNVEVWVVPGAGHTAGLRTDPEGWTDRVLAFLDEATR